ncbi:hypothetical protein F2Q69_00034423 [Brassica cretica]|uniref:Uncharacterized protein n=1 Tax=Brassica cretica TaxID=69181 RepID=A0A8S9SCC1_BRACR|nr:hypothetical protein F2Q69_00034423 [Brassica cretica]
MTTTLYLLAVVNRGEGMIFRSSPRKEGSKLIHLLTMMNEILRRESHHHEILRRQNPPTRFFEEATTDRHRKTHQLANGDDRDIDEPSDEDVLAMPKGPMTRSRSKKLTKAIGGLVKMSWKQEECHGIKPIRHGASYPGNHPHCRLEFMISGDLYNSGMNFKFMFSGGISYAQLSPRYRNLLNHNETLRRGFQIVLFETSSPVISLEVLCVMADSNLTWLWEDQHG